MSEEYLKNPEVIHLQKLVRIETNSLGRRVKRLEGRADKFHARLDKLESHPAGEPPTGDPASQPDSNTENPGRLVPIWVREYVEWKIDQRLGDKPPLTSRADSEIPERWQIQARPKIADGAAWEPITLERAKLASGVYQRRYQYASLHEAKQAFTEYVDIEGGLPNLIVRMATGSPKFTDKYDIRFVQLWPEDSSGQPAGGPPTPDLAAQLDSNKQDSDIGAAEETYLCTCPCPIHGALTQPIGVHDYNSLVACLRSNFKLAFGENALFFRDTDPQDMIQLMAAEIQNLRRLNSGSVQGLGSEVRVPTAENGPEER
jgi:hypothetical protein